MPLFLPLPPAAPPTVTYWAISVVSSRTMWVGLLTCVGGLLSLPDVAALIPLRFLPAALAVVGFLMMYLRTVTTRPVAFVAPGETVPVAVRKVTPPDPPVVSD